jgi:PAS domain S-box-containing protein
MDTPRSTTNHAGEAGLTARSAPVADAVVGDRTGADAVLTVSAGLSLTVDPDGRVRHVSPEVAAALGLGVRHLTGTYLLDHDGAGGSIETLAHLCEEVQRTGNTLWSVLSLADGNRHVCVIAPERQESVATGVVCTVEPESPDSTGRVDPASPLFAHAPVGMGLAALDGAWLAVNQALCTLVGHDRADLRALTVADVVLPEDRFVDFVYHRQLLSGELIGYQLEQRWLRSDGEPVWVLVAVSAMCRDGVPDHLLVQVQDISARREAEARAGLLAELVDCSVDAIWARDGGGEIVFWNRAAAQLLGYAAEDLVGPSAGADLPASRIAETAHVLAIAAGGRSVGPVETIRRHKDGHDVDVSLTVSPIHDAEGGLLGFASLARALDRPGAGDARSAVQSNRSG